MISAHKYHKTSTHLIFAIDNLVRIGINIVLAFTAPGEYTLHCFDSPPPPPPPPLTDTGSSDADDSVHVLRRAISRVSTQDSPLPSSSAGDLSDLRRQLRETAEDNRSLLVELVEMRREMNDLLHEALREHQTHLNQIKTAHTLTEGVVSVWVHVYFRI